MSHIEIPFILAGVLLYLSGAVWVLILALQKSFWWVLGCFFLPPVAFLFILFYWPSTKFPLVFKLCRSALIIGGVLGIRFLR